MNITEQVAEICRQYDNFLIEASQSKLGLKKRLQTRKINLYVSKYMSSKSTSYPRLVIGAIEFDKNFQGKGVLSKLLKHFENNLGDFIAIEVENILNPRLSRALEAGGYISSPFRNKCEFNGMDQRAKVFNLEAVIRQCAVQNKCY
ncbi:hypothetical protein AB4209_08230 [Vibrio sp. 10N.286.48.C11]|uniref:hypothetical protein n=1 Tax=Vibrio sp. 10N.286.48.C11 TaxID=3229698 RepID=UPI00354F0074